MFTSLLAYNACIEFSAGFGSEEKDAVRRGRQLMKADLAAALFQPAVPGKPRASRPRLNMRDDLTCGGARDLTPLGQARPWAKRSTKLRVADADAPADGASDDAGPPADIAADLAAVLGDAAAWPSLVVVARATPRADAAPAASPAGGSVATESWEDDALDEGAWEFVEDALLADEWLDVAPRPATFKDAVLARACAWGARGVHGARAAAPRPRPVRAVALKDKGDAVPFADSCGAAEALEHARRTRKSRQAMRIRDKRVSMKATAMAAS